VITSRKIRQKGHKACLGVRTCAYRVLVRGPEGKGSLGRPRCRRNNNIKMILQAVEWGALDWIDLALDRDRWGALVNVELNFQVS
jgi:hypothetical protein